MTEKQSAEDRVRDSTIGPFVVLPIVLEELEKARAEERKKTVDAVFNELRDILGEDFSGMDLSGGEGIEQKRIRDLEKEWREKN